MSDWFDGAGNGSAVDVLALLDSEARKHLDACIAAGALVAFGLTSDGGALGVTVTVDGRWRREYFRDSEQLFEWTADALEAVETAIAHQAASPRPRSRTRAARDR